MATFTKVQANVKRNRAEAVINKAEGQVSRPVSAEPSHGAVNQSPTSRKDKRIAKKLRRKRERELAGRSPFRIKAES
jgi:hypothetical protein